MSVPEFDDVILERLFPAPSFAAACANPAVPKPYPGITPESTAALRRLLIENHKRFHVYFDPAGKVYHNHLSHHLFASYTIGAPPRVLQNAFDDHASYQRPAFKSPKPITHENWMEYLGDGDFYNAYMTFFAAAIKKHGVQSTFEKYVFSHEANWGPGEPRMLDRFFSGLLHPMIHFGHAAEFGVDGMAIEGLAQTAVHGKNFVSVFDATFFDSNSAPDHLSSLASSLSLSDPTTNHSSKDRVHAFTILARILADDRLRAGVACRKDNPIVRLLDVFKNVSGIIREYASLWTINEDERDIQERVEELNWFVTLLFGVGGWKKERGFIADFILAHYVTSNLFLPSILSLLGTNLKYKVDLMRAYFATSLVWFIVQGRPDIDVRGFFQSVTAEPKPDLNSNSSDTKEPEGNPWLTIMAHTIRHPDEHQVKAARALAHGATLYGARPKGYFAHTELKGAEEIDGTLFVRTGGLLMDALHWNYEVKERVGGVDEGNGWSRAGLGWD